MAKRGRDGYTKKTDKSSSAGLELSVGLGEVGDVEIKAVASVDLVPLDVSVKYDEEENSLSVGGGVGVGSMVSVGAGVTIDLDTGSISGGSVSAGFGGGEVTVSVSECERTLQITYFGVGVAVSENTCSGEDEDDDDDDDDDQNNEGDEDDHKPPPIPSPNPPPDPNDIPSVSGFIVCETGIPVYHWLLYLDNIVEWRGSQSMLSLTKRSCSLPSEFSLEMEKIHWASSFKRTLRGSGPCIDMQLEQPGSSVDSTTYSYNDLLPKYLSEARDRDFLSWGFRTKISNESGLKTIYTSNLKLCIQDLNSINYFSKQTITNNYENKTYSQSTCSPGTTGIVAYSNIFYGWFPIRLSELSLPGNNKTRRPIPPEKNMNECCDVSVSLLRKIAKVLAVDEMLTPLKTSGKILKELEKGIDKVLEDPTLEVEIDNYLVLNTFLSLLSNRKVAVAVGCDELEFEKDQKDPKFHYLRWLKEYSEGLTPLNFQEWLTAKKKEEGLKASKTQFKSIPQLILAELYNSKTTVEVLRAHDLMKTGMEIPNELLVPGGLGFAVANDYPNLIKKIIQMIDLSTIQPFTAILQDSDPSKEGDQTLTRYYPDATSAVKEIVELLLENKVDGATRLNIALRQSILNTQQQVALLETLSIAYTIMYGLGLPFHQKGSHFVAPFDISPNTDGTTDKTTKGKGFNPKNKKEDEKVQSAIDSLNENSENATEKMLPDFLSTVRQEYLHTYFDDKKQSLWYYIMSVFMKT